MLTGVILAGGDNRRMGGKVKALLPFHGVPLIVRQIRRMKTICETVIVVTRYPEKLRAALDDDVVLLKDRIPGKGPLSGMHAAFSAQTHSDAWVVACDMPFISSRAAQLMQAHKRETACDIVVPLINGRIHPLHGIYDQKCLEPTGELLREGTYRVQHLLRHLRWDTVEEEVFLEQEIDCQFVINVNTPDDYADALTIAGRAGSRYREDKSKPEHKRR